MPPPLRPISAPMTPPLLLPLLFVGVLGGGDGGRCDADGSKTLKSAERRCGELNGARALAGSFSSVGLWRLSD